MEQPGYPSRNSSFNLFTGQIQQRPGQNSPQSPLSILLSNISFLSGFSFNSANWTLLLLRLTQKLITFFAHSLLLHLRHACLLGCAPPLPPPLPLCLVSGCTPAQATAPTGLPTWGMHFSSARLPFLYVIQLMGSFSNIACLPLVEHKLYENRGFCLFVLCYTLCA